MVAHTQVTSLKGTGNSKSADFSKDSPCQLTKAMASRPHVETTLQDLNDASGATGFQYIQRVAAYHKKDGTENFETILYPKVRLNTWEEVVETLAIGGTPNQNGMAEGGIDAMRAIIEATARMSLKNQGYHVRCEFSETGVFYILVAGSIGEHRARSVSRTYRNPHNTCMSCKPDPGSKAEKSIFFENRIVRMSVDLRGRRMLIVTPVQRAGERHCTSLEELNTNDASQIFQSIRELFKKFKIVDEGLVSISYNYGSFKTHEHLHVKLTLTEKQTGDIQTFLASGTDTEQTTATTWPRLREEFATTVSDLEVVKDSGKPDNTKLVFLDVPLTAASTSKEVEKIRDMLGAACRDFSPGKIDIYIRGRPTCIVTFSTPEYARDCLEDVKKYPQKFRLPTPEGSWYYVDAKWDIRRDNDHQDGQCDPRKTYSPPQTRQAHAQNQLYR